MATKKAVKATKGTEAEVPGIRMLAVDDLIPTPDNPRRIDPKSEKFADLVASVKARGVLVPVLARPHPRKAGKFDLRAGHRRLMAARQAKLEAVPAIVREMDDAEAMEVTVLENLQREDLHPLEEARGVLALMKQGKDARAIGGKIGKSPQWVLRRAALADLSPSWAKLAEKIGDAGDGDEKQRIIPSIAHLELMARFPHDVQESLLAALKKEQRDWLLDSYRAEQFAEWVSSSTLRLKSAPFDTKSPTLLPKAGSCLTCVKRSSCRPGLFDDELDSKKIAADDTCLDGACYKAKMARAVELQEEYWEREHGKILKVKFEASPHLAGRKDVLCDWQVKQCNKGEKGAKPALVMDGPKAGKLIYVQTTTSRPIASNTSKQEGPRTMKEKRAILEARRWVLASEKLTERINKSELPVVHDVKTMLALVAVFNPQSPVPGMIDMEFPTESSFDHVGIFATAPDEKMAKWIWATIRGEVAYEFALYGLDSVKPERLAELRKAAELIGADLDAIKAEADAEIPEPKSWAGLADDDMGGDDPGEGDEDEDDEVDEE